MLDDELLAVTANHSPVAVGMLTHITAVATSRVVSQHTIKHFLNKNYTQKTAKKAYPYTHNNEIKCNFGINNPQMKNQLALTAATLLLI